MNKVKGRISFEIYVECPKCQSDFDLIEIDGYNEEGCITRPLFNNKWDEAKESVICPHCEHEFEMHGIEY
ncbi:hypothetical protein AAEX90_001858 [Vibrio cholerae]